MRVWLYCISNEEKSCNELGIIRQEAIRFASERRMQVLGITSVNSQQNLDIENMVASAVENAVEVIVISNVHLLKVFQKYHLQDLCMNSGIHIAYAVWKGEYI